MTILAGNTSAPGQHSSYNHAQRVLIFGKYIGINPSKLTLGVPFYGYDFQIQQLY